MYDLESIRNGIRQLPLHGLRYFPEIGSTNTEGLRLLETGAICENTLLLAQKQTAGRGRFQRTWISDPDDSLTFSLVLTGLQYIAPEKLGLLPLLGAFAIAQAVLPMRNGETPQIRIKWPNDLLLNKQKVCGILSEACWEGDQLLGIVLGIGINVGQKAIPPVDDVIYPPTSIETALGWKPSREQLLLDGLTHLFTWLPKLESAEFHTRYENHLAFMGESVNIFNEAGKQAMTGIVQGISPSGDLILLQTDHKTILCSAGEITLRTA